MIYIYDICIDLFIEGYAAISYTCVVLSCNFRRNHFVWHLCSTLAPNIRTRNCRLGRQKFLKILMRNASLRLKPVDLCLGPPQGLNSLFFCLSTFNLLLVYFLFERCCDLCPHPVSPVLTGHNVQAHRSKHLLRNHAEFLCERLHREFENDRLRLPYRRQAQFDMLEPPVTVMQSCWRHMIAAGGQ